MVASDEDNAGAEFFGFADLGAGFDAKSLGFVAGGDAARGVGHGGNDGERFSAVLLMKLLFDRGEEAVQVDVQEAETVGMENGGHGSCALIIFAFYLPSITSYVIPNGSRKYREYSSSRRMVQPFSNRNFRAAPMSLTVKLGIGGCVFRSRFT